MIESGKWVILQWDMKGKASYKIGEVKSYKDEGFYTVAVYETTDKTPWSEDPTRWIMEWCYVINPIQILYTCDTKEKAVEIGSIALHKMWPLDKSIRDAELVVDMLRESRTKEIKAVLNAMA